MEESFHRLGQTLMRIEEDVIRLKHETQENRRDINEQLEDRDKAHTRLDRLEKEMEQRETASRQRNLKFLRIFEPTPGDDRADVDELLATLNYFSSSRTWKHDDIEGTHRIGHVDKTSRQHTRPLIVTFSRGDDKVSILRDRYLREKNEKEGHQQPTWHRDKGTNCSTSRNKAKWPTTKMVDCTLKTTGVRTTRTDTQTDTQHGRATRRTTSARKDNSLTPHVKAVSKTTTTSPVTTINTAKEATVINTIPMLETGTVKGTHEADVAGCMTSPITAPSATRRFQKTTRRILATRRSALQPGLGPLQHQRLWRRR